MTARDDIEAVILTHAELDLLAAARAYVAICVAPGTGDRDRDDEDMAKAHLALLDACDIAYALEADR
jgi:hypothetical protein